MKDAAGAKWLPVERLAPLVAHERAAGRRVVLTNGCFDLLHGGHRHLLREAAGLGDLLVVAVNSDESVRELKGPERPVHSLSRRVTGLAQIAEVDWIVSFADPTPAGIIERLLPDVLVKGDDWGESEIVGRDTVEARGGRVVRIPRLPGVSTSLRLHKGRGADSGTCSES